MPRRNAPWVLLATRIPKPLHRALKVHCVTHDTQIMMFVTAALEEKLRKQGRQRSRRTRTNA